jgi:hypothetical protein
VVMGLRPTRRSESRFFLTSAGVTRA